MSTIIEGRDARARQSAGHDEAGMAWKHVAVPRPQSTSRLWPAPGSRPAAAQHHASAVPQPATRERRGILSASLVMWLVVYTFLNVGDLLSTYFGLQAGLHEANPLMSGLLAQNGFGALIAYKLVVIVAVIVGAIALYRMHPRAAYLTVHVCNGLVFLAVFLNVAQMLLR